MNEIVKKKRFRKHKKAGRSINYHLSVLGLDENLLYKIDGKKQLNKFDNGKSSIYKRIDPYVLLNMAKIEYKKLMKRYHPDKHLGGKEKYYTKKSIELNESFSFVKRTLLNHGAG